MRFNRTLAFALVTAALALCVYLFEYQKELNSDSSQALVIGYGADQISYLQVIKASVKIGLQKSEVGWTLLEPIHEPADNTTVEDLLNTLSLEKQLAVVKTSENAFSETELSEFGLDKPAVVFIFKNNQGLAKKVSVGSVKNYEGKSYLQVDSENRVYLGNNIWNQKAADDLIAYRDKRIYRENLGGVSRIHIQSLQDKFELKRVNGKWVSTDFPSFELDQNKVRDVLRKISETKIEDYIFEGEPSVSLLKEKELANTPIQVELITESSSWSARINVHSKDNSLYILTDRPTYLAKVDPALWEVLGNQSLDALRDRSSAFAFSLDEVKKMYFKQGPLEVNLILNSGGWLMGSNNSPYVEMDGNQISQILRKIRDLRITDFVESDVKSKFLGTNMLILKSNTDKLVLQLNWGPVIKLKKGSVEKEYFLARTHLSDTIFALDKSLIENLNLEPGKIAKKSESGEAPPPPAPSNSEK